MDEVNESMMMIEEERESTAAVMTDEGLKKMRKQGSGVPGFAGKEKEGRKAESHGLCACDIK